MLLIVGVVGCGVVVVVVVGGGSGVCQAFSSCVTIRKDYNYNITTYRIIYIIL